MIDPTLSQALKHVEAVLRYGAPLRILRPIPLDTEHSCHSAGRVSMAIASRKSGSLECIIAIEDVSGVSGTGIVAEAIEFSDGTAALRWLTKLRSTIVYASMEDAIAIHGHDGRTRFVVMYELHASTEPRK